MEVKKWVLVGFLLLLAACNSETDSQPTPADTVLNNSSLPKIIVTVEIPSTVTPTLDGGATANVATASPTSSVRSTATATATPYVGVFIGQPTSVDPEGTIVVPPTLPPIVIIQPGSNPITNTSGVIPSVNVTTSPGGVVSGGNCAIPVAEPFANAYTTNPVLQNFGCPREAGFSTSLVFQPFEQGRMFWRDTRQILILSNNGTFWRVPDNWNETIPADDPALVPPSGLLQPVRGFGFAWRSSPTYQNSLGWALTTEFPISSYWQDFDGGSLFIGDNGLIFALPASDTGQYVGGLSQ